jgi:hypothetical protein
MKCSRQGSIIVVLSTFRCDRVDYNGESFRGICRYTMKFWYVNYSAACRMVGKMLIVEAIELLLANIRAFRTGPNAWRIPIKESSEVISRID